jgi:GTP pyrophosphokinase
VTQIPEKLEQQHAVEADAAQTAALNKDQLDMFVETNSHVKQHAVTHEGAAEMPADEAGMALLMRTLASYMDDELLDEVERAYDTARSAHSTQFRKSGEPYITHPVAVAQVLANMRMDYQTICAALMHDVIEDSEADRALLAERFDETIANLVEGVSKIGKLDTRSAKATQAANFSKMLMAMNDDIRVIIVKLADRLHNMRTLGAMPAHKKREKSLETLEIYAPMANRLGMNNMRVELEDLAFSHIHPLRYQTLKNQVEMGKGNRDELIDEVCEQVGSALSEQGIEARVYGREKHLYGIYRKIRRKLHEKQMEGLRHARNDFFKHVNDVYGVRLIVEDLHDCYRAMGVVHNLYRPLLARFKDYIAIPKANGYQALHTGFYGPKSLPFECQIRTTEMDQVAESGVAAHWRYKNGEDGGAAPTRRWLGDLLELQQATGDSEEFLDNVKIDLFPDEVYVFSPKGDVFRLPRGATVIDYAYAVHTGLGNKVYGARVDGKRVLLRTELRSGQRVELLTDPNAHPEPAWMNFVVTAKARTAIRQYQKSLHKEDAERIGRQMLQNALVVHSHKLTSVGPAMDQVLKEWQLKTRESLYMDIGLGRRVAPLVAKRLADHMQNMQADSGSRLSLSDIFRRKPKADSRKPLMIKGSEGLAVQTAKCCHPVPGDPIVGYLSSGRGVVVHHAQCRTLSGVEDQPERWVEVDWDPDQGFDFVVPVDIQVSNQRGVLARVAAAISAASADIENVQVVDKERARSSLRFVIRVRDRRHLADVFRTIRNTSQVKRVTRVRG